MNTEPRPENRVKWYEAYRLYLTTEHWRNLRNKAFHRANFSCEACRSRKHLQGHHLHYPWPLNTCTADDIVALCTACHDRFHARCKARGESPQMSRAKTLSILRRYKSRKKHPVVIVKTPPKVGRPKPKRDYKTLHELSMEAYRRGQREQLRIDAEMLARNCMRYAK